MNKFNFLVMMAIFSFSLNIPGYAMERDMDDSEEKETEVFQKKRRFSNNDNNSNKKVGEIKEEIENYRSFCTLRNDSDQDLTVELSFLNETHLENINELDVSKLMELSLAGMVKLNVDDSQQDEFGTPMITPTPQYELGEVLSKKICLPKKEEYVVKDNEFPLNTHAKLKFVDKIYYWEDQYNKESIDLNQNKAFRDSTITFSLKEKTYTLESFGWLSKNMEWIDEEKRLVKERFLGAEVKNTIENN